MADVLIRFTAKIRVDDGTGCWLWLAARNNKGYGVIRLGGAHGRLMLAHRVAYELFVGPLPAGLELDHLCRVPECVNPDHLEPVTHAENMRRGDGLGGRVLAALQSAKTHCPAGHPLSGANLYRAPGRPTNRMCRECRRVQLRASRARRRAG